MHCMNVAVVILQYSVKRNYFRCLILSAVVWEKPGLEKVNFDPEGVMRSRHAWSMTATVGGRGYLGLNC